MAKQLTKDFGKLDMQYSKKILGPYFIRDQRTNMIRNLKV